LNKRGNLSFQVSAESHPARHQRNDQPNLDKTGKIDENTTFSSNDFRNTVPRFSPEARKANQALVDRITEFAESKGATSAQIALAWVLAQKDWIVPIPGTTKRHRLEENIGAVNIALTADDLRELNKLTSQIDILGERYGEGAQKLVNR
jgi:aryl-alcohol dehydrogenase-like predicted oxidoreductase